MLNGFAERVMMRIRNMRARNFVDQPTGLFNRLRFEEDIHQTVRVNSACEIDAVDVITPKVLNDIVKAPGYLCTRLDPGDNVAPTKLLPNNCLLYKISPTRFGLILNE